jgi:hypothetical protein
VPLFVGAEELLRSSLVSIAQGARPPVREIGALTHEQFAEINKARVELGLHEIRENGIVFLGRHLFVSRSADGYTIDDMIEQIVSALDPASAVLVNSRMTAIQNVTVRNDRLGNQIRDRAIFEATVRKPRLELFSVIPKGDDIKPSKVVVEIKKAASE